MTLQHYVSVIIDTAIKQESQLSSKHSVCGVRVRHGTCKKFIGARRHTTLAHKMIRTYYGLTTLLDVSKPSHSIDVTLPGFLKTIKVLTRLEYFQTS